MTRLGHFSNETIAVDSMSADVELLEKLAARGNTLCEDDMRLLVRCNARLSDLISLLVANRKQPRSAHHLPESDLPRSKKPAVSDEIPLEC